MPRQTHTFATLEVSAAVFDEVMEKLQAAGYDHAFIDQGDGLLIDMNGIALKKGSAADEKEVGPGEIVQFVRDYFDSSGLTRLASAGDAARVEGSRDLTLDVRLVKNKNLLCAVPSTFLCLFK